MSTKHKTQTTSSQQTKNIYDPASMAQYQKLLGQWGPVIADYLHDPLTASYVQLQKALAMKGINQSAQRMSSSLTQNAVAGGWGSASLPGFMQSNLAKQGRYVSGMKSDALTNILLAAEQNRRWATGAAMSFSPLQTGQNVNGQSTQTQTTSGVGTWLAPLASAGLGAFAGYQNGGGWAGALAGAAGMKGGGGGSTTPPFFSAYNPNFWGGGGGSSADAGSSGGYWNATPASGPTNFSGMNPYYQPPWARG